MSINSEKPIYIPGLSWTLDKNIAAKFGSTLYAAQIQKQKVYAYFTDNTSESEIVSYVSLSELI